MVPGTRLLKYLLFAYIVLTTPLFHADFSKLKA